MADYEQPEYVEKRVRYFDGQFLKDQDFIDEQKYHIDRQRRHNRFLHVAGIMEGLTVNAETNLVNVEPGTAVDRQGRQIVLGHQESVPLADFAGQTVDLVISYAEGGSDQAQEGSEGDTRFHEDPELQAIGQDEEAPEGAIPLAKLQIEGSGGITVDDSVRRYSGVLLPDGGADREAWPTLRAGAPGRADLTGDLTVSGNVGIGTTELDSRAKLDVRGAIFAGTSDIYFTDINHNHTGIGNTAGYAAIENAENFGALMILGRAGTDKGRKVKLWDFLEINGGLSTSGNVGIGTTSPGAGLDVQPTLTATANNQALVGLRIAPTFKNADKTEVKHHGLIVERGNVGIGTTAPGAKLTVQTPDNYSGDTLRFESRKYPGHYFLNLNTHVTHGVVRWVFDQQNVDKHYDSVLAFDRGNVGIGTDNPDNRLEVNGAIEIQVDNADSKLRFHDPGNDWYSMGIDQSDGGKFKINYGGTIGDAAHFAMDKAGNVGIGTTSPLFKAHVVGAGGFGGEDENGLSLVGSVPLVAQGKITVFGILNDQGRQAFALNINGETNAKDKRGVPTFYDKFDGNWHPSLSLKNGNVGIGVTDPQGKLEVAGEVRVRNRLVPSATWDYLELVADGKRSYIHSFGDEQGLWIQSEKERVHVAAGLDVQPTLTATANNQALVGLRIAPNFQDADKTGVKHHGLIVESGNVGIGTTTPGAKLEVAGGGGGNVDLIVNGRLRANNNDGGLWIASDRFVGGHSKDQVGFWNGNAWRLTVQKDGNVGIGTAPKRKLHIRADGGYNPVIVENCRANNEDAKKCLDELLNNSFIIGGGSGKRMYFYWKNEKGVKYVARIDGDATF